MILRISVLSRLMMGTDALTDLQRSWKFVESRERSSLAINTLVTTSDQATLSDKHRSLARALAVSRPIIFTCLLVLCLSGGQHALADQDDSKDFSLSNIRPKLLTREEWHAKPALPGMKPQQPIAIILHNTGVPQNRQQSMERKLLGLPNFSQRPGIVSPSHTKPAWPDTPYHFYIDFLGQIAEGRDVQFAGDSNTNYDTSGYIQVVVEGEFDNEAPTSDQIIALQNLLVWLLIAWKIPLENISVHKDHAPTTCPGANFMRMLREILEAVKQQHASAMEKFCSAQETDNNSTKKAN
jgi:hypothetical protein